MSVNRTRSGWLVFSAVSGFVLVIFLQLAMMARDNSATWDEADHIYAGYMQWKHGDFGLNAEHPPLVKFLATLPLLQMPLKEPPLLDQPYRLQEVKGGKAFVFENDANAILFRVRLAASLLTLLLAVLVFVATREMFGTGAGLIALGLISFDPTLLAHSALMTTDAGQAFFLFWAVYAFYRYVKVPTALRLVTVGLVTGLALATKHSAVLLFPMLGLLALVEVLARRRLPTTNGTVPSRQSASRLALGLVLIGVISVIILWSWYGFRYAARAGDLPLSPAMSVQLQRVPSALEGRVLGTIDTLHLLPQSYTYGFAHVLIQSKAFTSYLLGTIYPHPVWFYFPIAMLIKSTLTFLILLGVALWAIVTGRFRAWREILYMVVPAGVYMVFAMAGGMNIGVRHVLPIYIFLSVVIAGAAWTLVQRSRAWLAAVVVLLVFQAASVLHAFPAYVSYANEAFGGPANVHKYLSDSSSDWGQQLKAVDRYLNAHAIKNCWFAYFGEGVADYSYYGIPCKPLITADSLYFDPPHDVPPAIDGPVLMSAGVLSGFEFGPGALNPYEQFKTLRPVGSIDDGVFIYDGHFDIPLAAALSHVQKAGVLLQGKNYPAALAEAQQAAALAPDSAVVNESLGQALDGVGQSAAAVPYYRKALALAMMTEPQFQSKVIARLERRLGRQQ
jgi:4-amino-4-deoxy-L-arabinose transferase-like glycosyltransferase